MAAYSGNVDLNFISFIEYDLDDDMIESISQHYMIYIYSTYGAQDEQLET